MLSLLIKPSSGRCQMRCRYCFYEDEMSKREIGARDFMSQKTASCLIHRAFEASPTEINFFFQGGEPTLVGLSFFQFFVEEVTRQNTKGIPIHYAMQTNGLALDAVWAEFLHHNHFLVGVSIDGIAVTHDYFRIDAKGQGTFSRVLAGIHELKKAQVDFNVVSVITPFFADHIDEIYAFYKNEGFVYQQYIPCLDGLHDKPGGNEWSLSPILYTRFLKKLFSLYRRDMLSGHYVYVRDFENWRYALAGYPPEECGLLGHCAIQFVVESDGSVYPCDFYAVDEWRLGNLEQNSLSSLASSSAARHFVETSFSRPEKCEKCPWISLCGGGCRRRREVNGVLGAFSYCSSYRDFFTYAVSSFAKINTIFPPR